jgi:hypothetical protein
MATVNPDDLDVVLRGKGQDVTLGNGLTSTEYRLTIEGAPTIEMNVQDRARVLFSSGLLDVNDDGRLEYDLDATLDGYGYRLSLFDKQGDTMVLTFIDLAAGVLMHTHGHVKPRNADHVAFAKRLVESVGFQFVTPTGAPAVSESQSVLQQKAVRSKSDDNREPGIPDQASLTVKGAKASAEQKHNMNTVLGVCAQEHAGEKATLAVVEACIVESEFINLPGGDRDSKGILQLRVSLHGEANAKSIVKSTRLFLTKGFTGAGGAIALAKAHPDWSAGKVAQAVQGSAFPARYDQVRDEARKIIAAFDGGDTTTSPSPSRTRNSGRSPVQVGTPENPNESYWTAMQRIASERGYRCFALHNTIYYGREQDFIRSRARMVISEQSPGVDWINGTWAPNARVNQASVICRASLWAAPPGSAVIVEDTGPLNGRWLVSEFTRSRFSKNAEITMRRGTELLKPEPITLSSSAVVSQSGGSTAVHSSPSSSSSKSSSKVGQVFDWAKHISSQHRPYVYGGGHGPGKLATVTPSQGLDCSSSVSLALYRAGLMGPTALVSGDLAKWGEPGPGKTFTIYANGGHVFIVFHDPAGYRFDTSPQPGDVPQTSGPQIRKGTRSTAGFVARHAPGDGR